MKLSIGYLILFILTGLKLTAFQQPYWKKYVLDTNTNSRITASTHQVVVFDKSLKISEIKSMGLHVERKFANNVFLIKGGAEIQGVNHIQNSWPANNQWKLIGFGSKNSIMEARDVYVKIISNDINHYLDDYNLVLFDSLHSIYKLTDPEKSVIQELIDLSEVRVISEESFIPVPEGRVLDLNLNPNTVNRIHDEQPEIKGAGETASIQEQRFDQDDIDLRGRVIETHLAANEYSSHATEMATIIGGAGNSFVTGRGAAVGVRLVSSDFSDVLPDANEDYQDLNIVVQNHSYGTQLEAFYGLQAEAFDISSYDNPYLLHVFSSGNMGVTVSTEGAYRGVSGFSNLTGNFKMAKNVLVVGSMDTTYSDISFVSRGPAYDGRVKPEVVSYSMVGSSNSSALASGIVVLLQDFAKELSGEYLPSSLLKSFLITAAFDVGPTGLDHISGYGGIDSYRTLQLIANEQFFADSVLYQEQDTFLLDVPAGVDELKVTLCWLDPATLPGSAVALVNDLDLLITGPVGDTLRPWVLKTDPDSVLLAASAERKEDHLNTIEQISVVDPEPGSYAVIVNGYDVPEGPQPFFITYDWSEKDQFEWLYPTGSDNFPYNGESSSYFRWKCTFQEPVGKLEYKAENMEEWAVLTESADLTKGFWRWDKIPVLNQTAVARMHVGGEVFLTDTFTISNPAKTYVGFDCGDSLLIQWQKVAEGASYELYLLEEDQLKKFRTTTDTFMILDKNNFQNPYVAVNVISKSGKPLINGYTFDYTLRGSGCFLTSFYQEVVPDEGIYLNLFLTTTYGIKHIYFERKSGDQMELVAFIEDPVSKSIKVIDKHPNQGFNEHRVTVVLDNGTEVRVIATNTYYLTEIPVLTFPNPVNRASPLHVYTKEMESAITDFIMYDRSGSEVLRHSIHGNQGEVNLIGLRAGLYFYQLKDKNKIYCGKVIVQ